MFPFAVCEKSSGFIFFNELFEHGDKMLNGIFFGILEIEGVEPFVNGMINTEFNIALVTRIFEFTAEISVRTDINAVPVPCIFLFKKAETVMML